MHEEREHGHGERSRDLARAPLVVAAHAAPLVDGGPAHREPPSAMVTPSCEQTHASISGQGNFSG